MKIKTDDTVVVISGKDKGKKGKVIKAMPKEHRVIVEGVNMQTKHAKQTRTTPAEIKHQEGPIDVSNVMYWDSKARKATRIGYKGTGKDKVRISKKSGEEID
ncbi:MAG: 50S ribosomal protein L24 [Anaerovoracaceae bacterium]|jgi:large subunit ribosomal protein L24